MRARTVMVSLVVGAVLATGCSAGRTAESRSVSAPAVSSGTVAVAGVIDLFRAGTAFIDHTSFRVDVDIAGGQITTMAHVDNVNKRADATVSVSGLATEIRMVGNDVYMKTDALRGVGDGWMVLDPAKIPAGFTLSFAPGMNDPGGSARLISAIVSAQVSGAEVTGAIDLTKVGTGNGISFRPPPSGGSFPDSARNQQFHATLDSQGRLVSFVIPGSNVGPTATLRYSEFGAAVTVSPPQGAVPAPDTVYPQLGLH